MITVQQIAEHNRRVNHHYFDGETLAFFGQHVRDFKVKTLDDGRIVVYCYTHRGWNIPDGIVSLGVYNPDTGVITHPEDSEELKVLLSTGREG